eukprot:sb/3467650/
MTGMTEKCTNMNEEIVCSEAALAETQIQVGELLRRLTKASAALEKIRAQRGNDSSLLSSLKALKTQLVRVIISFLAVDKTNIRLARKHYSVQADSCGQSFEERYMEGTYQSISLTHSRLKNCGQSIGFTVGELLRRLTKASAALEKIRAQRGNDSSLLSSLKALKTQLVRVIISFLAVDKTNIRLARKHYSVQTDSCGQSFEERYMEGTYQSISLTHSRLKNCGQSIGFTEDQQDMYEFLEDDYDPKMTVQERRNRRRSRLQEQYEYAKGEEATLTDKLNLQKKNVGVF